MATSLVTGSCRLRCLGPVMLTDAEGDARSFRTRKQIGLLLYLARRVGRPVPREELIELLWSSDPEKAARHSLSQTISLINKALKLEAIVTADRDRLTLVEGAVSLDVVEFERLAAAGDYDGAMKLWKGTLLDGVYVQRAPAFERWLSEERGRLERAYRRMALAKLESLRVAGDYAAMKEESERLLQLDSLDERAMLAHLESLLLLDDRTLALRRYAEFAVRLKEELSAEPDIALRTWAKRTKRGEGLTPTNASPPRIREVTVLPTAVRVVGRQEEFGKLWKAWEEARLGHGAVYIVDGPAGIGKSALVTKLANQVHLSGGSVCFVTCYRSERSVPFAPITALVKQLSRLPGFLALDPMWIGELTRLVPELRERHPNASMPMVLDDAARHRLSDAVVQAALAVADEQPLLVAVDDLQDSDEPTLALLHYLCRQVEVSAMVVGVRRVERETTQYERTFFASIATTKICRSMTLGALPSRDAHHLARQIAASRGCSLSDQMLERVCSGAQGNPLQLIEGTLTATLDPPPILDSASGVASDLPFHTTAQQRLQSLPSSARLVASTLAVAGHPLSEYEISVATDLGPADLGSGVLALEHAQLAVRMGSRIRLSHDRYAAAIEDVLDAGERAQIHERLALMIADAAASNPAARCQAARHFELAGDVANAASHAEHAVRFAAQIGARRNEADALQILRRVGRNADEAIDLRLARCLLELNKFDELADLCTELRTRKLSREGIAELTFTGIRADFEAGRAPMKQLAANLQKLLETSGSFQQRSAATLMLIVVADKIGDYRRAIAASRSLRRAGSGIVPPDRYGLFAAALLFSKYYDPARSLPLLRRVQHEAQANNDWYLENFARDVLGVALKQIGRFQESVEQFETSLALARKIMNPQAEARCLQNRLVSEMALGDDEKALSTCDEADAVPHESWSFRTFAIHNRAVISYFKSDYDSAAAHFQRAWSLAEHHDMKYMMADSCAGVALCKLRQGKEDEFLAATDTALSIEDPSMVARSSWITSVAKAWRFFLGSRDEKEALRFINTYTSRIRRWDIGMWLSTELERILLIEGVQGSVATLERLELNRAARGFGARAIVRLTQTKGASVLS